MEQKRLIKLYTENIGEAPAAVLPLPGAGSNRRYYRMTAASGDSYIGCIGTSIDENQSFIRLSDYMLSQGLSVPRVICHSADYMLYIQEDLGTLSLFDALRQGRSSGGNYSDDEIALLRCVMSDLPNLQFRGGSPEIFQYCYPQAEMDASSVMYDLNYFKYCFLKLSGLEFNEIRLQTDFDNFCADLLVEDADTFLYRDFQARNVMLHDGRPYYIDFQGGRRGPIYYDVASFLWQASAKYSESLRQQLIDVYWDSLQSYTQSPSCPVSYYHISKDHFLRRLNFFVLFRTLQVLGAYGFRGLWERKQHFLLSIPPAIENLRTLLAQDVCHPYPYLKQVLQQLVEMPQFAPIQPHSNLIVHVNSFSYKKGVPADNTGNGGGYVFDCRSTNNPGRYPEFKDLTGLDKPVIDFLEHDGEILQFLDSVYALVDFHTQRWLDRGFTDLQINFGCTGGQHRSVYCAQHVAEHLNHKFGVEVHLCHRERDIQQIIK